MCSTFLSGLPPLLHLYSVSSAQFNSTPSSTLGKLPVLKEALADAVWEFTGETAPHHSGFTAGLCTPANWSGHNHFSCCSKISLLSFPVNTCWIFQGFLVLRLVSCPTACSLLKLIPYGSCDYQWFLLISLYFRGQRDLSHLVLLENWWIFGFVTQLLSVFFLFVCLFCRD